MKKIYKLLNRRGNVQRRIQGGGPMWAQSPS